MRTMTELRNFKKNILVLIAGNLILILSPAISESRDKVRAKKKLRVQKMTSAVTSTRSSLKPQRSSESSGGESDERKTTVGDLLKEVESRALQKGNSSLGAKRKFELPEISGPISTQARSLKMVKPPPSVRVFRPDGTDEGRLEAAVDGEIEELYKLTQKYRASPQRGEMWLRLGELYVEKSRLVKLRVQNDFDRKYQNWESSGKKGRQPVLDVRVGDVYRRKAVQLYEWFVKDFPNDSKLDQALFFLGYSHFELSNEKVGAKYYDRVSSEFPKSPFVQETHFSLGEYYFENENWEKAVKHYSEVLKSRRAATYSFSMYKMAWCYYRLGKADVALRTLEDVVKFSRQQESAPRAGGLKQVNRVRLGSEALRDLVPFYADVGDHRKAYQYFKKMAGEDRVEDMLEQLGAIYSDLGKKQAARHIYEQLIELKPTSPKALDFQKAIASMYSSAGEPDIYRQELTTWIRDYGPGSRWSKANEGDVGLISRSVQTREETLRNHVLKLHQVAQNSGSPYSQNMARESYELYLKNFSEHEKSAEMHFFFGELLYDLKEYEKAGLEYQWVSDNAPKSKYHQESVLNTVLSFERLLPKEVAIRQTDRNQNVSFGENEARFIRSAERYIETFPKTEKTPEVKFKVGRLHYLYNHLDEALVRFEDVVSNHSNSPQAVFAANLILDIYNLKKDYQGLAKAGRRFIETPTLVKAGLDSDVKNVVERASFKQAQDLEIQKDFEGSAKEFEEFTRIYPQSRLAGSATYNAAVNYERAGNLPAAIVMYDLVQRVQDPRLTSVKNQSRLLLARLYERTGQFQKAAVEFERYAADNPQDPKRADLFYNSAVIYEALGNFVKAQKYYETHFQLSRKLSRVEVLYKLGLMFERNARWLTASKYFEQFIQGGPQDLEMLISAHLKVATMNKKMGRMIESEKWYRKTLSVQYNLSQRKPSIGSAAAAEAKFNLTMNTYSEFRSLRIPSNPKTQEGIVRQKLALLNKLAKELTSVIKFDSGSYVIAALTTLGSAYEHMSDALYAVPAPNGFNDEEKKIYQTEVDRIASPLRQKAVENYRAAIDKSHQIDIYNEHVLQARSGLSRYDSSLLVFHDQRVLSLSLADREP